ncbi:efflux RND transporter periplasmic adaptor subunit [Dongia sp.]|uniref:efflux RND transporter periplasmic adaptor subunit n=1 Tax=Dongia sp. TaxID=1977262 RepID=UPI0035B15874
MVPSPDSDRTIPSEREEAGTERPLKHRRRGLLAIGAAAITVVAGAALFGAASEKSATLLEQSAGDTPRSVTIEIASVRLLEASLPVTGSLVARDEVAIGTAVEGQRVSEVLVEEGDWVTAGQVLLKLETDILEIQRRDAESRVVRARAAAAQQEALLSDAEAKFRRAEQLSRSSALTKEEHGQRHTAFLAAGHALDAAQAELTQAQAQLAEAQTRLERAVIHAPAAGIVSERPAKPGSLAGAEPLVKLIREGEIEFEAEVPEADLPRVDPGQAVRVLATGMDQAIEGQVRRVAPKVDRETRLGLVRIALPSEPNLRSGVFARGAILLERREALTLSSEAVIHGTDGPYVFVVGANDRAIRRPVETGVQHDGHVEIRSGLADGDRVVSRSGAFLRDGEPVIPASQPLSVSEAWR